MKDKIIVALVLGVVLLAMCVIVPVVKLAELLDDGLGEGYPAP